MFACKNILNIEGYTIHAELACIVEQTRYKMKINTPKGVHTQ